MVMQDILVACDSGWWKSSAFLVIGELTNLILVIGELRGYIPLCMVSGESSGPMELISASRKQNMKTVWHHEAPKGRYQIYRGEGSNKGLPPCPCLSQEQNSCSFRALLHLCIGLSYGIEMVKSESGPFWNTTFINCIYTLWYYRYVHMHIVMWTSYTQ